MAKKSEKPTSEKSKRQEQSFVDPEEQSKKISNKVYETELAKLHIELVKLQGWIKEKGLKVVVLFEGRDAAGKGGTIKRITETLNPRIVRVVALATPAIYLRLAETNCYRVPLP